MTDKGVVKRYMVTPDKHAPLHDRKAISVVRQSIEIIKPDGYIDLGDLGEWGSVSHWQWKKKKKPPLEYLMPRIEKDVDAADVGEETWRQIRSTLGLAGYPQLFAPVIGAMRNYDAFRKDTIVDPWMEETISPNEQRSIYTSNVARSIAEFANSIP